MRNYEEKDNEKDAESENSRFRELHAVLQVCVSAVTTTWSTRRLRRASASGGSDRDRSGNGGGAASQRAGPARAVSDGNARAIIQSVFVRGR